MADELSGAEVGVKEPRTSKSSDGAWEVVKSRSKQRKPDAKSDPKKGGSKGGGSVSGTQLLQSGPDTSSSAFAALDSESRARRARIEASQLAAESSERKAGSDSEEDDDELFAGQGVNGVSGGGAAASVGDEKKKEKKPKKPKVTVAEAASALTQEALSAFLLQINESFATMPDVQLMRCADFFGSAFSNVTPSLVNIQKIIKDSSLAKAIEIPFVDIPEPIVTTVVEWVATKPADEVGKFVFFLVKAAVEDAQPIGAVSKHQKAAAPTAPAKAKVGLLVLLSILLRKRPESLLSQADAIRTAPHCQGQERLLVLTWVYGQVAAADLVLGMWLWVRNLLPFAVGKQSTPISRDAALSFLETVVLKNLKKARPVLLSGAFRKGERLIPPAEFNLFFRAAFPLESARTKATERFEALYPLLKEVALVGSLRSKSAKPAALQLFPLAFRAVAEGFLPPSVSSKPSSSSSSSPANSSNSSAAAAARQRLFDEANRLVAWSLAENPDCFKQWEKVHLEEIATSTAVLTFLNANWVQFKGQLAPFTDLAKFLKSIRKKNVAALADISSDDYETKRQLKQSEIAASRIQAKISSVGPCLSATVTLVAATAMAYGFYLLSPKRNPWGWDGFLLLSQTHRPF